MPKLNSKNADTLKKIFERPSRPDIRRTRAFALLEALGAIIVQRNGSRVCVKLGDSRACFHAPHPANELCKGAVKDLREFLENAGVDQETVEESDD
jgi:hypothetical protein